MTDTATQRDSLWSRLAPFAESALPAREVWTESQLRRLLEKERFRAGRREIPFAFITWELLDGDQTDRWAKFGSLACETLRLTDEIGCWKSGIAILLTDTDFRGAETAANKLRARALEKGIASVYEMYVYPDREQTSSGQHRRPQSDALRASDSNRLHDSEELSEVSDDSSALATIQPQALGALFVQPVAASKRIFDVVSSLAGLILLSPLLLAVALAVKLTSKGPVIFTQRREGRGGRDFTMYKFRTMCVGAEARQAELRMFSEQDGPAFKMSRDPRLTPIGRFLRKTCLDEAPQLLNVIKGDMSVVGPRPLPIGESHGCTTWQRRRLDVLPGMTCSWQAEAARQVTFDDWMRLDLRYSKRPRVLEDLRLLFRTVVTLVQAKASV